MSSEVETSSVEAFTATPRDSSTSLGMTNKLFTALDVYHDIPSRSAAMNMAIDEALFESANAPSIRFYRWDHRAISFGYFGNFADVSEYKCDLVRRWTGGGIVFHGDDLTYSIVIPSSDSAFAESSMSIYEKIHRALRYALIATGEPAELSAVAAVYERRHPRRSAVIDRRYRKDCFANPVRADVLINGRKVAGAAQRRTRRGLLQQGSIHVDFENGLTAPFGQALSANCNECKIENDVLDRACKLVEQKYGTDAWFRKR